MDSLNNNQLIKKLGLSRYRLISSHPFFAIFLVSLQFQFSSEVKKIDTDAKTIYINPNFLNNLSDRELDIVLLHEVMHIALKHPLRKPKNGRIDLFHLACDIVVNSSILYSSNEEFISAKKDLVVSGEVLPHLTPDGKEGNLYSAEDVYKMLIKDKRFNTKSVEEDEDEEDTYPSLSDDSDTLRNDLSKPPRRFKIMEIESSINKKGVLFKDQYASLYVPFEGWDMDTKIISDIAISEKISRLKSTIQYDLNVTLLPIKEFENNYLFTYPYFCDVSPALKQFKHSKTFSFSPYLFKYDFNDELRMRSMELDLEKEEELELHKEDAYLNYLDIPDEFKFVKGLVNELNFNKMDTDIFEKVVKYVKTKYQYKLNYPMPENGEDEMVYFMTTSHIGLCRHFASAATFIFRALGIPTRYVEGLSVDVKKDKTIEVFDDRGHAWIEVFIDNVGWVPFDPTPISASLSSGGKGNGSSASKNGENGNKDKEKGIGYNPIDEINKWKEEDKLKDEDKDLIDEINSKLKRAIENTNSLKSRGRCPGSAIVELKKLEESKNDWRTVLTDFVQENIIDYSFTPPDYRFSDFDFILPGFNEPDETVKSVIFMVDVSGSMSWDLITDCFSEIKGAIDQFDGKLKGWLGFFDDGVRHFQEFDIDTDISKIKVFGQGGTDFDSVFRFIKKKEEQDDLDVSSIIILTDGYAPFPSEKLLNGHPIIWVITNDDITPPYGKILRIKE